VRNFKDLSIKHKLIISFLAIVIMSTIASCYGIKTIGVLKGTIDNVFGKTVPALDALMQMDRDLQQLLVAERSMIFATVGTETFNALTNDYDKNFKQAEDRWNKFKELQGTAFVEEISAYESQNAVWRNLSKQIVEGRKSDTREGRTLAIDLSLKKAAKTFEDMREEINKIQDKMLSKIEVEKKAAAVMAFRSLIIVLALTALALIVAYLSFTSMLRFVVKPIVSVVAALKDISQGDGDLTCRLVVESADESGQLSGAFNQFIEKIETIIKQVKGVAAKLADATTQISASAQQISNGAQQQSASFEELSTSVQISAQNAGTANDLSRTIAGEVEHAGKAMNDTVDKMSDIERSSAQIAEAVNLINDIADQTNLLALNAAIEAARAGEHGKGFAVVADEVRKLAERSASSAKDIVTLIQDSLTNVETGVKVSQEAGKGLEQIISEIKAVAQQIEHISTSSHEQAAAMEQNTSITESNAAASEQLASAAEDVSNQATVLQELVHRFKVGG
jgi:methyl-accepting chemotaxis protein